MAQQQGTQHRTGSAPAEKRTTAYCAQNHDPACAAGTYVGPHAAPTAGGGYWDDKGNPVDGGPVGANGSTGNGVTQVYCAQNEDPGCPAGTYVGPGAIKNPDGSNNYVPCEGSICTNPNHGGGDAAGSWDAQGQPINGGPQGANGSTDNNVTREYCAQNEDPGCPVGSYVGPKAIKDPDGSNNYVPCEGSICTNPNHGGGDNTNGPGSDTAVPEQADSSNPSGGAEGSTPGQ
ncbi:mesocentin [Mycobacterium sp. CBMA271]|nr:mesocentin [Mycobacteroides sp. CBMA 271]